MRLQYQSAKRDFQFSRWLPYNHFRLPNITNFILTQEEHVNQVLIKFLQEFWRRYDQLLTDYYPVEVKSVFMNA